MPSQHRNDHGYVVKREALKRWARENNEPCALCSRPFDFDLDWFHPMSFTADHVTPISRGGSLLGPLQPAHRACNSRRGNRDLADVRRVQAPRTSRQW
jgi:5-methylcytosine-specific restriction endonuclease McrA